MRLGRQPESPPNAADRAAIPGQKVWFPIPNSNFPLDIGLFSLNFENPGKDPGVALTKILCAKGRLGLALVSHEPHRKARAYKGMTMPNVLLTADSTVGVDLIQNENYFLAAGVTHATTASVPVVAITGIGNNNLFIDGAIVQFFSNDAISAGSPSGNDITITIGESGSIYGNNAYFGIRTVGDNHMISNAGAIVGGTAIRTVGNDTHIFNTGTITSTYTTSSVVFTVSMGGNNNHFDNSGIINGSFGVIVSNNSDFANSGTISAQNTAVLFDNSTSDIVSFINSGIITSVSLDAIEGDFGDEQVINTGEINGAVDLESGDDVLLNSGTIVGNVDLGSGDNTVENLGIIIGDVIFDTGTNSITNTGMISGDVTLGSNADSFRGNGGTVSGTVSGGLGDDVFYTDQADVVIDGGDNFDTLIARGDVLDTVSVELIRLRGSDDIGAMGDMIANEINGNIGDNVINGGGGEDTIRGGAGDDELTGSNGRDILIGGQGADVFIYNNAGESTVADADRVRNFTSGDDIIDLSSSSFNGLVFIDAAGFAGTGGSELRVTTTGSTLRVEADTDGDGNADLRIVVTGEASLGADDFLL